jgi:hypothetical protein
LLIVGGSSVLVLPYLLCNQLMFGSPMPVSGLIESTFPHASFGEIPSYLRRVGKLPLLCVASAFGYLAWHLWYRGRDRSSITAAGRYHRGAVALLALSVVLHFAHEALFIRWPLSWHFVLATPLCGAIVSMAWQSRLDRHPSRAAAGASWVLLCVFVALCGRTIGNRLRVVPRDGGVVACEAGLWIRHHLTPGVTLAMRVPEIVGYFSERQVVDLGGLISNLELQHAVFDQHLRAYLSGSGVQYMVGVLAGDPDLLIEASADVRLDHYKRATLRYRSHLFGGYSDPIVVRSENEVYRSAPYQADGETQLLVIWRVRLSEDST